MKRFAILIPLLSALAAQAAPADLSVIAGRPTDTSVTLNVLSASAREGYVEYSPAGGGPSGKTSPVALPAGVPVEIELKGLAGDTQYAYRLFCRAGGGEAFEAVASGAVHTQRAAGRAFTFGVQGDSHPERPGKMYDAALYARTMANAAKGSPDFYIALGDDFSIERLIERKTLSQKAVDEVYARGRPFLAAVGAPVFLVNGNHEQAARANLDQTAGNAAVLAGRARGRFYSLPAPDGFYTGDAEPVEHVGLLRDYYAWTWGDALFVVIDPYWHSKGFVDNVPGERKEGKKRDLWEVTLGDAQYRWLTKTLTGSKARWKFVFTHHVLGTGRGGVECATLGEWGGKDRRGRDEFAARRPGWPLPIHQLMVKAGVTVFFQGHDHLFARQSLDGVVYQSCPNPADPTYQAFNRDAYRSGQVLPNSGHLRVSVSPEKVRVEYIRSWGPKDATKDHPDGETAFSYEIPAAGAGGAAAPTVKELARGFAFTEGPAVDAGGNIFFSDVHASKTYRWTQAGAKVVRENTGGANGLAFDAAGNLLACEGGNKRVVSVDARGRVTVVADTYKGKPFNQPNDLWIDPKGGVYFTDPIYGRADKTQDGEHVYYVSPDRRTVTRVIDDMVRPNGLTGASDGKSLYVADHGAGKTWRYAIRPDGTLADKTLFAPSGSDGMKIDAAGNVYLTADAVLVYDPAGTLIARVALPQTPTNLCFMGKDGRTLFVTARSGVYAVDIPFARRKEAPGRSDTPTAASRPRPRGTFRTDVPAHRVDIVPGRPTDSSVTLSVLSHEPLTGRVVYGTDKSALTRRTEPLAFGKAQPREVLLAGLAGDTTYYYRLEGADAAGRFHTRRAPGGAFTFTVAADSHLDENTDPALYARTLTCAASDSPDFHIDLGDTFMTDKHAGRESAAKQYLAQRYYLGLIGRACPVFLVLGNHDGEDARGLRGGPDSLALWSNANRKRYFPNPVPDAFYSGNAAAHPRAGLLQDYYAWTWGDALFVVLDPYWFSPARWEDCWSPTLGAAQYQWLRATLQASKARYKFVFIHQLVGGAGRSGRGGAEAAVFGEWGGRNADGSEGLAAARPGWPEPIHALLVRHKVTAVFHGHDHFYARQERDGVVYQEVPQPGFPEGRPPRQAGEYGYGSGTILGGAGYLRVSVGVSRATVEYVQTSGGAGSGARVSHAWWAAPGATR